MRVSDKARPATFARSNPQAWAKMTRAQHRAIRKAEAKAKRAAMFAAKNGPRFSGGSIYEGRNGPRAIGRGVGR